MSSAAAPNSDGSNVSGADVDPAPSATLVALRQRAELLAVMRAFFKKRGVLEVETPLLARAGVVDAHLDPIPVTLRRQAGDSDQRYYLMTSPELAMKRLLAAGSGPIYELTRAFRDGEEGRLHNPEFTILEWYRPGHGLEELMDEVEELVTEVFAAARHRELPRPFTRLAYQEAFQQELGLDPLSASVDQLRTAAVAEGSVVDVAEGSVVDAEEGDRDAWLNLLLATRVESKLGVERPTFLHRYPASQAALARLCTDDERVAERVELYIDGVEIANGYHELSDALEQRQRFLRANEDRRAAGKETLPIDERFLAALENGLPDACGIALGVDRLILLACGAASVADVMAFPIARI